MTRRRARLVLEDGSGYEGVGCGADGVTSGEVVFNTSMTGYQEILTDPSYAGQIVTMTVPRDGQLRHDRGRRRVAPAVRLPGSSSASVARVPSNWRSGAGRSRTTSAAHGIVAIAGIDTRALTRRLRSGGVMRGAIATGDLAIEALLARARRDAADGGERTWFAR